MNLCEVNPDTILVLPHSVTEASMPIELSLKLYSQIIVLQIGQTDRCSLFQERPSVILSWSRNFVT